MSDDDVPLASQTSMSKAPSKNSHITNGNGHAHANGHHSGDDSPMSEDDVPLVCISVALIILSFAHCHPTVPEGALCHIQIALYEA